MNIFLANAHNIIESNSEEEIEEVENQLDALQNAMHKSFFDVNNNHVETPRNSDLVSDKIQEETQTQHYLKAIRATQEQMLLNQTDMLNILHNLKDNLSKADKNLDKIQKYVAVSTLLIFL